MGCLAGGFSTLLQLVIKGRLPVAVGQWRAVMVRVSSFRWTCKRVEGVRYGVEVVVLQVDVGVRGDVMDACPKVSCNYANG